MHRSFLRFGLVLICAALIPSGKAGWAFSVGKSAPDISGGPWINSSSLSLRELRNRVVLVEFWTYG